MKLNVTQATILAGEVRKSIVDTISNKKDLELNKIIQKFLKDKEVLSKKTKSLEEQYKKAKEEHEKHIGEFNRRYKTDLYTFFAAYSNLTEKDILQKINNKKIPSLDTIKNKIIMKSLFGTEKEMKDFLDNLIKEYI